MVPFEVNVWIVSLPEVVMLPPVQVPKLAVA